MKSDDDNFKLVVTLFLAFILLFFLDLITKK